MLTFLLLKKGASQKKLLEIERRIKKLFSFGKIFNIPVENIEDNCQIHDTVEFGEFLLYRKTCSFIKCHCLIIQYHKIFQLFQEQYKGFYFFTLKQHNVGKKLKRLFCPKWNEEFKN